VASLPEPEPDDDEPVYGDGDLDTLVVIMRTYRIKSITLE
jgi:hypothetical protein